IYKNLSINYSALPAFLHVGYIPHPYTIYNHVHKLSAGAYMEIATSQEGNLSINEQPFWNMQDKISGKTICDEASAKKQLNILLRDTISNQLISDVPIGTFLSGGTDSSIVTAIAADVSPGKINTFSIAVTDGKVNEAPFAAAVSKHL